VKNDMTEQEPVSAWETTAFKNSDKIKDTVFKKGTLKTDGKKKALKKVRIYKIKGLGKKNEGTMPLPMKIPGFESSK
jgi:hypothetical protein